MTVEYDKTYDVHLMDEIPKLGSGKRSVKAKIGYKWVHLSNVRGDKRTKIKKSVWEKLGAIEHE